MKFIDRLLVTRNLKFLSRKVVKKFSYLFIAFLIVLSGTIKIQAQEEPTGFIVDKIIGKVDNYIVLKSELDKAFQEYVSNGGSPSAETRCQFLAMLLRNKLMMAKAEIDSVVVGDSEVDANTSRRMEMILAQYGGSPVDLENKFGKTLEQIRLELRDQIREQMVVNEMQRHITKDIAVTPAEVRRFFSRIPKDSLPFFSAEAEVAQIVRIAKVSEAQKEVTRQELVAIRDRILNGEDFATLAKKYSADPSVTVNGGDMGFVGRGMMVPEFEAASFKLKPGEISMPIETMFGLHIVQLLERRGNEYHSRHILMSPSPSPEDLEDARKYLDSIRILIVEEKLTFEKAAKEYSDDVETKGNGGFFIDDDGGSRIAVDELDPVVFFAIDSMKVGGISSPLVYRTETGKEAVRILYYKSRVPPHQASLKDDWQRIQNATLNQKQNRALEKWFDKARKDVFISIDPAFDYCGILDD
ncbi:MAG: peptidylprolyl isomerase [Cyclobacteriaceae bacterium]|nr:peptidylprolyl isomerase [Cyclobacteriaceae bacterium]